MKESWISSIPILIDQQLKDNSLYIEVKDHFNKFKMIENVEELKSYGNENSFTPLILTTKNSFLINQLLKNSNLKANLFYFPKADLDLLASLESNLELKGFELVKESNWSDIKNLIYFLYDDEVYDFQTKIMKMAKKSLSYLAGRIKTDLQEFTINTVMPRDLREILIEFVELEEAVFSSINFDQAKSEVHKFLNSKKIKAQVKFFQDTEVEYNKISSYDFFLPLKVSEHSSYFICINSSDIKWEEIFSYKIFTIYSAYLDRYILEKKYDFDSSLTLWENILATLNYPLALFNSNGELVKHNAHFINLGLLAKDLLKLENQHKIIIDSKTYLIFRSEISIEGEDCVLFLFKMSDSLADKDLMPTNEELGIVTSSIAHELNNPLAGIAAALEVILLEDFLSASQREDLKEIQKGAYRCKKLVETFLGFSRAKPENISNARLMFERDNTNSTSISNAFSQSLDLIRFRLIENNLKLIHQYNVDKEYVEKINGSIFAMIFYLLFGELITLFSHYQLVTDKDLERSIKLVMLEKSDQLVITVDEEFFKPDFLLNSKLIGHLINLENHELQVQGNKIILKSNSQLSL